MDQVDIVDIVDMVDEVDRGRGGRETIYGTGNDLSILSTVHEVHLVHNVHPEYYPMKQYDDKKNYCRMLGHSVSFLYCRLTAQNTPCRKIRDCWFETLPIDEYINAHFSMEEQQRIFKDPEPKITSLLDLIAQAKNRADGSEDQ